MERKHRSIILVQVGIIKEPLTRSVAVVVDFIRQTSPLEEDLDTA